MKSNHIVLHIIMRSLFIIPILATSYMHNANGMIPSFKSNADKLTKKLTGFKADQIVGMTLILTTPEVVQTVIDETKAKPHLDFETQAKRLAYLYDKLREMKLKMEDENDERNEERANKEQQRKLELANAEGPHKVTALVAATKQLVESMASPRVVAFGTTLTCSIVGIKFGFNYLKDALDKPILAIESSILSKNEKLYNLFFGKKKAVKALTEVLFEPQPETYIQTLTTSYLNAIENGAPFRNVLLYGPPGTGKTAIAKTIARFIDAQGKQGMDYIYFAASNLDQFPLEEAIKAINGLFTYAQNAGKKLMIIVDECEVLFANRNGTMSEQARKMLTAFLTFTGQPSKDFVIIGLTNRREAFDTASLSRFYEQVYVGAPDKTEQKRIFEKYSNDYLRQGKNLTPTQPTVLQRILGKKTKRAKPLVITDDALSEATTNWILNQINGFVGRDIENLIIAMQSEAYATGDCTLTEQMVRSVTSRKVAQVHSIAQGK